MLTKMTILMWLIRSFSLEKLNQEFFRCLNYVSRSISQLDEQKNSTNDIGKQTLKATRSTSNNLVIPHQPVPHAICLHNTYLSTHTVAAIILHNDGNNHSAGVIMINCLHVPGIVVIHLHHNAH